MNRARFVRQLRWFRDSLNYHDFPEYFRPVTSYNESGWAFVGFEVINFKSSDLELRRLVELLHYVTIARDYGIFLDISRRASSSTIDWALIHENHAWLVANDSVGLTALQTRGTTIYQSWIAP
jgi:hypothetical protein